MAEQENILTEQDFERKSEDMHDGNIVLRTDRLVKIFKKRRVVNEVSINISQGQIVGLLGPNGAGKTTIFRMVVGLLTPRNLVLSLTPIQRVSAGVRQARSRQ